MAFMRTRTRLTVRRATAAKRARRPTVQPSPIVKWAGGKTKLLSKLTTLMPATYRRYYEPFIGGGAMFFHLAPQSAVINDRNPDLINMYRCVAYNVEAVIKRLLEHREAHCENYFYAMRSHWNDRSTPRSEVERAAAFIYLNKTCFNGLWRVNSKGMFNVPVGRYESPQIFDPAVLRAASGVLQQTELSIGNFADACESASAGDFLYFDPPYQPVSTTANFVSYTKDAFDEDNQRELAALARSLAKRNCAVMLSNSDTPFIRKLYKGFRLNKLNVARAINSKASKRGSVPELIICSDY